MYLLIWEPTHWELDNLYTASIIYALEDSMILKNDNGVDEDLYNYLRKINAAELHLDRD